MINEILYMQIRILREFAKKYKTDEIKLNKVFEKNKIYDYIKNCYDELHTVGDNYIIKDIKSMLDDKGVKVC